VHGNGTDTVLTSVCEEIGKYFLAGSIIQTSTAMEPFVSTSSGTGDFDIFLYILNLNVRFSLLNFS
jgi:hypothetical protein